MKSKQITIERETIEQIEAELLTSADPSASNVLWSFPPLTERPSAWLAGSWLWVRGAGREWEARTKSPTIGTSGASWVLSVGTYGVYVKFTVGDETPVLQVGILTVE